MGASCSFFSGRTDAEIVATELDRLRVIDMSSMKQKLSESHVDQLLKADVLQVIEHMHNLQQPHGRTGCCPPARRMQHEGDLIFCCNDYAKLARRVTCQTHPRQPGHWPGSDHKEEGN